MSGCREVAAGSKATPGSSLAVSGPVPDEKIYRAAPLAILHVMSQANASMVTGAIRRAVIPTMPEFVASMSYGKMRARRTGSRSPARARTQQQRLLRDTAGSMIDS